MVQSGFRASLKHAYLTQDQGPAPYKKDLLSLPDGGGIVQLSSDNFPKRHCDLLDGACTHLLRSPTEAAEEFASLGISGPHVDAAFRNPAVYGAFISDLHKRGLVKYTTLPKSHLGFSSLPKSVVDYG